MKRVEIALTGKKPRFFHAVDEFLPITFLVWNNAAYNVIADAMRGALGVGAGQSSVQKR